MGKRGGKNFAGPPPSSSTSSVRQESTIKTFSSTANTEDADLERALQLSMQESGRNSTDHKSHATSSSSPVIPNSSSSSFRHSSTLTSDEELARLLYAQFEEEDRLARLREADQQQADESLASAIAGAEQLRAAAHDEHGERRQQISNRHAFQAKKFVGDAAANPAAEQFAQHKSQRSTAGQNANTLQRPDNAAASSNLTASNRNGANLATFATRPVYPNVFIAESRRQRRLVDLGGDAGQALLPVDTDVRYEDNYQQWTLPPPKEPRPEVLLKKVAELEEIPRIIFQESGVAELNPVQSTVFDVAWSKPFENMLVCAPTGAGKTNIALTCIARVLYDEQASLKTTPLAERHQNKFKIVYLAPMKALTHEICSKFRQALKAFNCNVKEMTGDTQLTQREKMTTNLIVATPEKWDVIMRQGSSSLLDELKLLIIDEIHLINEDRGPVLETLIARTVRQIEVEQRIVRMVGLSATLPNYDDVGTFLRVNLNVGLFFFDDRFRPVPLTQSFVGIIKNKHEYPTGGGGDKRDANEQQKMDVLFDILCEQLQAERQVLIFVHSRRGTAQTARALLALAAERGKTELFTSPILMNDAAFKHTMACKAHGASAMSHLKRQFEQIEDRDLQEFMRGGLGGIIIHHAGMRKEDRRIVERGYLLGAFPVLVSTATLAWGVNLPADTIIIYGTKVYDQRTGKYADIDALDIQQMFGRAGRPQFRQQGYGIIITPVDDVAKFMRMLNNEQQIESRLAEHLSDHLNAEIALNNISSVGEAIAWLRETYMYLHMLRNPMQYGINISGRTTRGGAIVFDEGALTVAIQERLEDIVRDSAVKLQNAGMIKFMAVTGALKATIIGKIASKFYVSTETMQQFFALNNASDVEKVLNVVCGASEFTRMIERPDEVEELDYMLERQTRWRVPGTESAFQRKTNILLQAYFNGYYPKNSSTLLMDQRYAVDEAPRLARAIMSMGLALNAPWLMLNGYTLASMIEHAQWPEDFPLLQMRDTSIQFYSQQKISRSIAGNLMRHRDSHNIDQLRELDLNTIAAMAKCQTQEARMVLDFARRFPLIEVDTQASHIRPVTCTAGKLELHLVPKFLFDPKFHGGRRDQSGKKMPPVPTNLRFHIMIVCGDEADAIIVAHQEWTMTTADIDMRTLEPRPHKLELFVPIAEQQARSVVSYMVYVFADTWLIPQWYLGEPINFDRRNIPAEDRTIDLHALLSPISVEACGELPLPDASARLMLRSSPAAPTAGGKNNTKADALQKQHEYNMTLYYERLYAHKPMLKNPSAFFGGFDFFNAVQSHTFHAAYHTNTSIFLGAPTGSGKTTIAELCMLRLFQLDPQAKCVYIAPLKALVRERMNDWQPKFWKHLQFRVVELTGESQPDARAVREAHIIVTTPEKWDGISRHWQSRQYVRKVKLVVIDEIHMIGQDRGPVLEVIVARIRSMNNQMLTTIQGNAAVAANSLNLAENIRIVGLSTPLTNARQLALWLGCREAGIFNISSAYRPVRLEIHIDGFAQRAYCPRMNEMNGPTYRAIVEYGQSKPVLIFVASRRQTRVTARAMVSNAIIDGVERFNRVKDEDELRALRRELTDRDLEQCLQHGVGYHNAGMTRRDREIVEHLFKEQKISILVATATLAWGVNLPAHMVVVKGTEFFDGKTKKYVQFPVTDVIQMTGRAGRPQYDKNALAFVFVQDKLKDFYKTFLHSPFPVESGLAPVFIEHLNAEIVAGTVRSLYHACQYLYSTFLAYRLVSNPKYYGLQTPEDEERQQEEEYAQAQAQHEEKQRHDRLREQKINITGMTSRESNNKKSATAMKMYDRIRTRKIAPMQERIDLYIQKMAFDESSRLVEFGCATMDDQGNLEPTFLGSIASYYYLQPKTVDFFYKSLCDGNAGEKTLKQLLSLLSEAPEFDQVPVRHNEDNENRSLAERLQLTGTNTADAVELGAFDNSHTKALLLLFAHLSGKIDFDDSLFPSQDYKTDLRSVLDQLPRILQALLDITAELGLLDVTMKVLLLSQMLVQGMWWTCDSLQMLGVSNRLIQSRIRNHLYAGEAEVQKKSSLLADLVFALRGDAVRTKKIGDSLRSLQLPQEEIEKILEKPLKLPVLQISRIRLTSPAISSDVKNTMFYFDIEIDSRKASGESNFIRLYAETEYSVEMWIDRAGIPTLSGKMLSQFVSPYYQKIRDESWRVILGRPDAGELLAMTNYQPKASSGSNDQMISLKFTTPSTGVVGSDLLWISLLLISEQFLGLDLQYDFCITVQEKAESSGVSPFVDESNAYSAQVTTSSDLGVAATRDDAESAIDLDKFDRLLAADAEKADVKLITATNGYEAATKNSQKILALTSRDLDLEPEVCYVTSKGGNAANFASLPSSSTGDKKRNEKFGQIWKAEPEKLIELQRDFYANASDQAAAATPDVILLDDEGEETSAAIKRALFEPPRPKGLDSMREELKKQQPEILMNVHEPSGNNSLTEADGKIVAVPWYKVGKPSAAAPSTAANLNKQVTAGKRQEAVVGAPQLTPVPLQLDDDIIYDEEETENASRATTKEEKSMGINDETVAAAANGDGAWWKRSKK